MRNRLIITFITVLGLYLIVVLSRSIIDLWQAGKRIDEAKLSLLKIKEENISLKKRRDEVKSREYVEKIAREKLGLVKPGESVVILPEDWQNFKPSPPSPKPLPNWQQWYKLFF